MSQPLQHSNVEAIANSIIGAVLGQLVLWLFGVPITEAVSLNITMIGVSYARAFALRRLFERVG